MIKKISYKLIKSYRQKYIPDTGIREDGYALNDIEKASFIIRDLLLSEKPCMVSRFGDVEMDAVINYRKGHPLSFLRTILPFWVGDYTKKRMTTNAGFFPNDNIHLAKFADLIIDIAPKIDVLGSWLRQETYIPQLKNCRFVQLKYIEPFWSENPWSSVLEGKKILIIHPFKESIRNQYERREKLFEKKNILPKFESLHIIKAVQSIGGVNNGFHNWFEALDYMKREVDNTEFDIALIGCGAYGMPLAAHCKDIGKKAIHLGGALQLLFGIRGSRWEDNSYEQKNLMNDYWVRPLPSERPVEANAVENACYW